MSGMVMTKTPIRQIGQVKELLANEHARNQLAAVAASHMTPERMMRLLALAIEKTPRIAECTPMSVLGCLMTCSSLGLEANTPLQHAYIIPRRNGQKGVFEATLQIGYRGYVQLAHNSGQIAGIDAGVHYSDDEHWLYRKGAKGVLEHVPGPEKGEKLHAYAVVTLTNGNAIWNVWPWAKVLAHRDQYSDAYKRAVKEGKKDTPWITQEDTMAMKTMIRQLAKFMPMASEISRVAALDGARADYAGFAMNPLAGLPEPETGAGTDDAELVEDDESAKAAQAEPEQEKAPERASGPKPETAAKTAAPAEEKPSAARAMEDMRAKAQAAAKDAPAPAADKPAPAAPQETAAAPAEPGPFDAWIRGIQDEALDLPAPRAREVLEMWETEVAQIRAGDPEAYRTLEAWIAEREAMPEGEE